MKKYFVFLIFILALLSNGCKKITTPDKECDVIFGRWQLTTILGGMSGGTTIVKEDYSIEISENGIYKSNKNKKKIEKSKFTIETRNGYYKYVLVFKGESAVNLNFNMDKDRNKLLLVQENVADGSGYGYVRIK